MYVSPAQSRYIYYPYYLDLIHRFVLVKGESVQIQQIPEIDLTNCHHCYENRFIIDLLPGVFLVVPLRIRILAANHDPVVLAAERRPPLHLRRLGPHERQGVLRK